MTNLVSFVKLVVSNDYSLLYLASSVSKLLKDVVSIY